MLSGVKTKHNITKCFVSKSSIVCIMVKYVVEIMIVWFQLFIWRLLVYQMRPVVDKLFFVSCDVIWYKIKLSRFKMARNVEKLSTRLLIWCYAWCLVIKKILSWLVFKMNLKVQAIMCALSDIYIFFKSNISIDSGKIMQISSHFVCCIGFIFCKNFTVQYHGFEK